MADFRDVPSRVFDLFAVILIVVNVAVVVLNSIGSIRTEFGDDLDYLTIASVLLFTVEYLLRIWSCVDHPSRLYESPLKGRLKYAMTPLMIIDFAVILPFCFSMPPAIDLRILCLFRLLFILRLTHYSDALRILVTVLRRESRTIAAIFLVMTCLLLSVSFFIYLIERDAQPETFASIPQAMWWSISTLTTVGYGDAVPSTPLGKLFGMAVMLIGIGTFAIPTGILVSAFSAETKRKDFVATWNLVAKVPIFSNLDAAEIAGITELLRLRSAMPDEVIIRKGEIGDRMYFIVAGEVEVERDSKPIRLNGGDFFGELGVLYKIRRTANVRAETFVELLQLEGRDFEAMLETNPKIGSRITQLAGERRLST